jgi:hypothetical protein
LILAPSETFSSSHNTPRAYARTSCFGRVTCAPEHKLPRPPPGSPHRARASACSPSHWALVAPTLGHTEALCAAQLLSRAFSLAGLCAAVAVLPPPLAGDRSGRATTGNHSVVSQSRLPAACLPARAPPRRRRARHRRRVRGGGEDRIVKVLKLSGA